jgi:hypothetical protein
MLHNEISAHRYLQVENVYLLASSATAADQRRGAFTIKLGHVGTFRRCHFQLSNCVDASFITAAEGHNGIAPLLTFS